MDRKLSAARRSSADNRAAQTQAAVSLKENQPMSFQSDDIAEARANIAAHAAAEQARINRLVKEASKETDVWAAQQALAKRQAEQDQEAAQQAREAEKEAE